MLYCVNVSVDIIEMALLKVLEEKNRNDGQADLMKSKVKRAE